MTSAEKKQEYVDKFHETHPNYFKEYREKNHDKLSQYYVNNRERFFRYTTCEFCGKEMLKANVKRHQRTKLCAKHALKLQESNQEKTTSPSGQTLFEQEEAFPYFLKPPQQE